MARPTIRNWRFSPVCFQPRKHPADAGLVPGSQNGPVLPIPALAVPVAENLHNPFTANSFSERPTGLFGICCLM